MFKIGDKLTKENYTAGAIWCNKNGCVINPDTWVIEAIPEPLPPTKEEQQQARQQAYRNEVDPITCHIQRLGDEEQTAEIIAEIARLVEERKAKVEEIKARYPYPSVQDANIVSVDAIANTARVVVVEDYSNAE